MGKIGNKNKIKLEFKSTGLLTKLTVHDIECMLVDYFGGIRGKNICVPNISWGMFKYEMDFVIIAPNKSLCEIEIKRSWNDFMADFKKEHIHDDIHVQKFYYCVPQIMAERVLNYCKDEHVGVISYNDNRSIIPYREPKPNENAKMLDNNELYRLARLTIIRFWKHRDDKFGDDKLKYELSKTQSILAEIKADYKSLNNGKSWKLGDL